MRSLFLTALISTTILFAPSAFADTFTVEAPIKSVTVYRDGGALVTRMANITLPKGEHIVTVQDLHEELLNSSLQPYATVTSGAGTLTGLKLRPQASEEAASEHQAEIQRQINSIEHQIKAIEGSVQANDIRLGFIKSIGSQQAAENGRTDFKQLQESLDFVGSNASRFITENQRFRQEQEKLLDQKKSLERELARSGKPRADYQKAELSIVSNEAQTMEFAFQYFVKDASWHLGVNSALTSSDKKMDLTVTAAISQQTGENWENVKLSLSNARPDSYIGDAKVTSQFISFASEGERLRYMSMERSSQPKQLGVMSSDNAYPPVTIASSKFDRRYDVSEQTSIRSSGEEQKVELLSFRNDVTIVSRAVPYRSNSAYVFVDTSFATLPAMRDIEATLSRDNHYVGTGLWPNLEANMPLALPFGADPNIEINYIEQAPEDGSSGLINKRQVEEKRYLVKVTNHHASATRIEIFDRYPVATHEDIRVTPLKTATKPNEMDLQNRPGVIKWSKMLEPGETWLIRHEYQVSYPADQQIKRVEK